MILLHHPLHTCPPSVPTCHAGDKGARIYDLDSQSSPPPPWKEPPMPIMGMLSRACVRASQDKMHAGDSICRQADCSVYLDESSFITQFLPGPFLLHRLRACRTLAQVQTIAQRRVPCVPVTDMSLTVSPHLTPEGSMTALSSDTSPGSGTICSMACSNSQPQKSPSRTSRTRALQIRQSGEGEEGLGGRGEGGRAKETQKCRAIVLAPSLSTTS